VGLELAEYVFVSFVDFNNLANGPNGHLSRKSILFTDAIVDELLECPVIRDPVVVGYLGYVVARLVKPLHSMEQEIVLLIIWGEFHQKRKLHQHTEGVTSCLIVTFSFLPPINRGSPRRYFDENTFPRIILEFVLHRFT